MQELVKQKFEPEKFAGVFSRGGSGPPRWLDGLLQDRCGAFNSYFSIRPIRCLCEEYVRADQVYK